jgi:hypothetical protein
VVERGPAHLDRTDVSPSPRAAALEKSSNSISVGSLSFILLRRKQPVLSQARSTDGARRRGREGSSNVALLGRGRLLSGAGALELGMDALTVYEGRI